MKNKKILFGFILTFCFFFLGNMDVEAFEIKICEYSMGENAVVKDWGNDKILDWTPKFKVIWADNNFVAASFTSDGKIQSNDTLYPAEQANKLKQLGITDLSKACPQRFKTKAVWTGPTSIGYGTDNPEEYVYELTSVVVHDSKKFENLSCVYGGNSTKGTEPPYYWHSEAREKYGSLMPGKEVNGKYQFSEILLDIQLKTADTLGLYSVSSRSFKSANTFLGIVFDPDIKDVGGWSVYHIEQVLSWLETKTCPEFLLYHPNYGFYLSTSKSGVYENDVADLKNGQPSIIFGVWHFFYPTNEDSYAMYQVSYTKQCNEILSQVNWAITQADDKVNNLLAEIKKYITGTNAGNLTKENYEKIKKEVETIEQNVINAYIENDWSDFFEQNKCNNVTTENVEERKNQLLELISGETAGNISNMMIQAIDASKKLTASEKKELKEDWKELENKIIEKFEKFSFSVSEKPMNCETLFGDFDDPSTFGGFLQVLFNYVKIIAPILLIVFGTLDFGKAVLASDQDALKKAQGNFIKRCIAAVALFLLPTIIMWILELLNQYISGAIDPNCMIK